MAGRTVLVWTLVAVLVRAIVLLERPFLHMDGPAYIGIAQRLTPEGAGRALAGYFPPLFPGAIRLAHASGLEWEAAGRAVAALAGVALVPLAARLGAVMLGAPVGHGAAALAAVHPRLVRASTDVLPETLGALLVASVVLLVLRRSARGALAAGALAGLAGQVRPELVLLAPLAAGAALLVAERGRRLRGAAAVVAGALAVLVPLALAMHGERGAWVVSGKERYFLARKYGTGATSLVELLLHDPGAFAATYARFFPRQVEYTFAAMEWMLAPLFVVGIAAPARDARRVQALSLLALAAVTAALAVNPGRRYVVPWLPLWLPWIVRGGGLLLARAGEGIGAARRRALAQAAVLGVLVARSVWPEPSPEACYRSMCAWVAAHGAGGPPTLMADDARMAWVCGGTFVLRPHRLRGRGDEALRLAAERGATVLVVPARERAAGGGPTRPPDVEVCRSGKALALYEVGAAAPPVRGSAPPAVPAADEATERSRAARPRTRASHRP